MRTVSPFEKLWEAKTHYIQFHPRHAIVKLLPTKGKENIFKAVRKQETLPSKRTNSEPRGWRFKNTKANSDHTLVGFSPLCWERYQAPTELLWDACGDRLAMSAMCMGGRSAGIHATCWLWLRRLLRFLFLGNCRMPTRSKPLFWYREGIPRFKEDSSHTVINLSSTVWGYRQLPFCMLVDSVWIWACPFTSWSTSFFNYKVVSIRVLNAVLLEF